MFRHPLRESWKNSLLKTIALTTTAATLASPFAHSYSDIGQNAAPAEDRPNILVVMTEDMSPFLGCYGDEAAVTPTIDRFAEEGVRYTNVYATMGVCAPSRCSFITGMYQQSIGGQHMRTNDPNVGYNYRTVPAPEVKAFPELLRAAGYYTFTAEKLDYQFSAFGIGSGPFTIWDNQTSSYNMNNPNWRNNTQGQPFFGLLNPQETHESKLFANYAAKANVVAPEDVEVPPYFPDTPVLRQEIAKFYNQISYTSETIFKSILDNLEKDGLVDSTIVVFTADHGGCYPRHKRELYDTGLHVPMIIRWPEKYRPADVEPGTVDDRMISFVDLAPTILSLAGADVPEHMQGQVVLGDNAEQREYIYGIRDRVGDVFDRQRAVRDNRYKYMYNFYPEQPVGVHSAYRDGMPITKELWRCYDNNLLNDVQKIWFEPRRVEQLYDTWSDPYELNNVAADPEYADVLARMRRAYNAWMAVTPDLSEMPESEMIELFWPGGVQPVTEVPKYSLSFDGEKALVSLEGVTEGSSIGYQIVGVDSSTTWRLYTGSFEAPLDAQIRAKAVRYGYRESGVVTIVPDEIAKRPVIVSTVGKIVAGCAANIPATVTFPYETVPFELGLYNADGALIEAISVSEAGKYTFRVTASDTETAGVYVVKAVGAEEGLAIDCVPLPTDIWSPVATRTENGVTVTFASEVTFNASKKSVKLAGVAVDNARVGTSGRTLTVSDVSAAEGQTLVIAGIKYADLFPSYSFTFTLAIR